MSTTNTATVPNAKMVPKMNTPNVSEEVDSGTSKLMTLLKENKWTILGILIVILAIIVYIYYPFSSKDTTTSQGNDKVNNESIDSDEASSNSVE